MYLIFSCLVGYTSLSFLSLSTWFDRPAMWPYTMAGMVLCTVGGYIPRRDFCGGGGEGSTPVISKGGYLEIAIFFLGPCSIFKKGERWPVQWQKKEPFFRVG